MSKLIQGVALSAGLLLAACGGSETASGQSGSGGGTEIDDIAIASWVTCFMISEDGDTWFVKQPTPSALTVVEMDTTGSLRPDFVAEVSAAYGDELGENPSQPTCFVRLDEASAEAQIGRFLDMARSDNKTIREV